MFDFWNFLMIERCLTLWPMAYGQLQEWESVASGTYWEVKKDFPARLPALFLRPPTAAIYSDPRWKLVKGFRLHRYVAISFCIVAPVGQFPRSAFARKRPSGCGGRRVIGSGGERERQSAEKLQQILINSHRRLHHLEQLTKHKKSWSILNLNKSNISFIRKKCT